MDQQPTSFQHGVDLAGNPVVVVRSSRIDDQVSQSGEGRPEVRRIGELLLQARKLNHQAIELDLFMVAAMELRHECVTDGGVERRVVDRMTSEERVCQRYIGRDMLLPPTTKVVR